MTRPFPFPAEGGLEPSITELLQDPLLHLILDRDDLQIADVHAVIQAWQGRHGDSCLQADAA